MSFRGLIMDLCGDSQRYQREINILTVDLTDGIVDELEKLKGAMPEDMLVKRVTQRLYVDKGLDEELARWGVESWALALNIVHTIPPRPRSPQILTVSQQGNGQY